MHPETTITTRWKPAIPKSASATCFGRLPDLIALALERAGMGGATRRHRSEGGDARGRRSRKLPVLRKSDLARRGRRQHPPFGGFNVTAPGRMRRLLMSPGPIFEPEGARADFWGAARALFAAGFRPGDVVHNCFAYHLTPGGFIMESGAQALGCAVIPAGTGNTEQQLEAITHFKPGGYVGTPDFLKILLDAAARRARMFPRSSAGSSPARRCRHRCARSWPRAASRYCSATPPPISASSPMKAKRARA